MATRLGLPAAPADGRGAGGRARPRAGRGDRRAAAFPPGDHRAPRFDLVRAAKARGVAVTCGVTPAHLLLSDIAIERFPHLRPPLAAAARRERPAGGARGARRRHDRRDRARATIRAGPEDKRLPFADAAPGMAGAETLLRAGADAGARRRDRRSPRLFALLAAQSGAAARASTPARSQPGAPADLILVDPGRAVADRRRRDGRARAGNTPFDGLPVQGRVLRAVEGRTRDRFSARPSCALRPWRPSARSGRRRAARTKQAPPRRAVAGGTA